jgi:hypothetical protein
MVAFLWLRPYHASKATYSLDVDTTRILERVAERWGVSKSEALRRAIRSAAAAEPKMNDVTAALDRLRDALSLTDAAAAAWARHARAERKASSKNRGT